MNSLLESWEGAIEIDGTPYEKISDVPSDLIFIDGMNILFKSKSKSSSGQAAKASDTIYRVTVRQYMTKQSTPDFDFMKKWNNDVPMPLRTMVGTIEKETNGMYYMKLHADTSFSNMQYCMKCGKPITNPVSQYFGMGPECGCHNYVNPFETTEQLKEAVENYKKEYLSKIKWEGWVIKSSITEMVTL